jgi:predicted nucleic acid-binding protein
MLYLDTAALVKLVRRENESDALADWLTERSDTPWVTSTLAEVELGRALRRTEPELLSSVPALLARLYRCEIDATVRATAAAFSDPAPRTLDAIHLATALVVLGDELTAFVTYDQRLLTSAQDRGFPVATPGRTEN